MARAQFLQMAGWLPLLLLPPLLVAACDAPAFPRDWDAHPAVVTRDTSLELVALGDVHGAYDRLIALLQAGGLIAPDPGSRVAYRWSGADRVLVCTGDVIDKGDRALLVIDLLIALAPQAMAAGGQLIVTMGNHEAEFLADPTSDKVADFVKELRLRGLDPRLVAAGDSPYGVWLRDLPIAARINGWFFSHGGRSGGRTVPGIAEDFRAAVSANNWSSPVLIGEDSILEARTWWSSADMPKSLLATWLVALGAKHFVFGHDPSALGNNGRIDSDKDTMLVLVDVGMSPAIDYSPGELLFITRGLTANGMQDVATRFTAAGKRTKLFDSPP